MTAALLADRVLENTSTTGVGPVALSGAPSGYQTFASGIGVGNTTYYTIRSGDGLNWEVGLGTVGGLPGAYTLARTTVLASSQGGSFIVLVGASQVWCDLPASAALLTDGDASKTLVKIPGSTVARLLAERLSNPVNVIDYGAVGDGVADDYPAILRAVIVVTAAGGGTLYFPGKRTYRIGTAGVHGIHFSGVSNLTIEFGAGSVLLMDNMVNGLAVSHGVFIQGPCSNISLARVHVRYSTMATSRQTWAPIYFLGANVGSGNEADAVAWARGAYPAATETPAGIASGAVKNVKMTDCISENSPSVFVGIVGVDGIDIQNFVGNMSWADGLYHLYFRRSHISGVHLYKVGDDAISMASYESDPVNANLENDFHGEGSSVSDVHVDGLYPADGSAPPAGAFVVLGVRDVQWENLVCEGKYACIRVAQGTWLTPETAMLNLNLLASRGITFRGVACANVTQAIKVNNTEVNTASDPKWWQSDILIDGFRGRNVGAPFDVYSSEAGAEVGGLLYGLHVVNASFKTVSNAYAVINQPYNCTFRNIETDGPFIVYGSVPYSGNVDLTRYPDNLCTFENIRGSKVIFQGLKNCFLDNIESFNAADRAIVLTTCSAITFGTLRAIYPNRSLASYGAGVQIDGYCKHVHGELVDVVHDATTLPSGLSVDSVADIRVRAFRLRSALSTYFSGVSDALWTKTKVRSVLSLDWFNSGSMAKPLSYRAPEEAVETPGDANWDFYPATMGHLAIICQPLTAARTFTLHEDDAAVGERVRIVRPASATGAFSVAVQGQAAATSATGETQAIGSFIVAGTATTDAFTSVQVNSVEQLSAPVAYTGRADTTATALAAAIAAHGNYQASAYRDLVVIQALAGTGALPNGYVISVAISGGASASEVTNMAGGLAATAAAGAGEPYVVLVSPSGQAPWSGDFVFGGDSWKPLGATTS